MHEHSAELSIGLSFLLGILHAIEPGHGKTAMYVYMLEKRRSIWHPLTMGITTAISHACSLIFIAFLVHMGIHVMAGDEQAGHEHAGEALQWISSLLLIGIGSRLLWRASKRTLHVKQCSCCNKKEKPQGLPVLVLGNPSSEASHGQLLEPKAHHQPQAMPTKEVSSGLKMTILLGIAVGMLPCPTALAAYFAGLSSGNPLQGYWVIAVFSAGIALSLTFCGYVFQYLGGVLRNLRGTQPSARGFAYLQGLAILGIGLFYLARTMTGEGH